jgi:hypothetical protein
MADKAISELAVASSAADTDELVLNQNAGGGNFNTKRIALSAFKSALNYTPIVDPVHTGTITLISKGWLGAGGMVIGSGNNPAAGAGAHDNTLNVLGLTPSLTFGASNAVGVVEAINGGGARLAYNSSADHRWLINGSEKVRLDANRLMIGYTSNQSNGHVLQVNGGVLTSGLLTTNGTAATTAGFRNLFVLTGGTWVVNAAYGTGHGGSCIVGVDVYGGGAAIVAQAGWGVGAVSFQLSGLMLQGSIGSSISGPIYWYATKICG